MRTTIDLPEEIMRAAKIAAAERHISLKDLFTKALAHEVGTPASAIKRGRVRFPLIGADRSGPKVGVSNEDIADIFAAEDAEKYT
ncbi:MAG: hypothetical protein J2P18_12745 [Nocardia sp.]|nr:hypothetical protein [Nocardia sp.]